MHPQRCALVLLVAFACSEDQAPEPGGPWARIEVRPSSLLLTEAGASQRLEVVAFDADGRPTSAPPVKFSASSEGVSVAADGTVERRSAEPGSAQIFVDGEGVSATVFVLLAKPVAGAKLVDDDAVLSTPTPVEGTPFRYRVRLAGTFAPNDVVIASGSAPVSGRVISTEGDRVELEYVAPEALFERVRIEETFDLTRASVVLPEGANYGVRRVGDRLQLATSGQALRPAEDAEPAPPCSVGGEGQLSFSSFVPDFDTSLSVDLKYDDETLQRLVLMGDLKSKVDATVGITGALEAKFECKAQLFVIPVPITGALQPILGVQVPLGVGLSASVKGSGTAVGGKLAATPTVSVQLGFVCTPDGACEGVNDGAAGIGAPKFEPVLPSGVQVELGLSAFGYADLSLGNAYAGIKLGGLKAGPVQSWNVRSEAAQIDDLTYASSYDFKLALTADVGLSLSAGPLSVVVAKVERKIEHPLALSPKGTLTTELEDAETVRGRVTIDPTTLAYLGVPNVDAVTFYRYVGGALETLATVDAESPTQSTFEATWPFAVETDAGGEVFHAFIETPLLPLFGLEAPRPLPNPCDPTPASAVVRTQEELDALAAVKVSGSLTIVDGVTNLFPLNQLETTCGNLVIRSAPALISLAGLEALKQVQGTLQIEDVPVDSLAPLAALQSSRGLHLDLPELTSLAGLENLAVANGSLVTLLLPSVQSLAPLAKIGPELARLEVEVDVDDLDDIAHLTQVQQLYLGGRVADLSKLLVIERVEQLQLRAPDVINVDALAQVGGLWLLVLATPSEVVSLPEIPGLLDLGVWDGPQIVSMARAPTQQLFVSSETLDTLVLGGLLSTDTVRVTAERLEILDLTGLVTSSEGVGVANNAALEEIAASSLQTAGEIYVADNPALTIARFGGLTSVVASTNGAGVGVQRNDALTSVQLGALTTIAGDLTIQRNPALTNLDLSSLQSVSGNIDIRDNPMLDIDAVRKMLEGVEAERVVIAP
ncbi:MAG: hypothetical protein RMA76_31915 [Deltaproteobacteria bacterium]|jgi:hypothetical protein